MVALSILGCSLAAFVASREPTYNCKTLSYWVERIDFTATSEGRPALAKMGTNAIRFLLREAEGNDLARTLHRVYQTFRSKLPKGAQRLFPKPKPLDYRFPYRVASALSALGPSAIPALKAALDHPNSDVRLAALRAVADIGAREDLLPAIARLPGDRKGEASVLAGRILSMWPIRFESPTVTQADGRVGRYPGMIPVQDRQYLIGPGGHASIVTLTMLLDRDSLPVRTEAALALWRLYQKTNGLHDLEQELRRTPDPKVADGLRRVLAQAGAQTNPFAQPPIMRFER